MGAACVLVACQGCSIYLAHDGHHGANLESFGVGTPEQEVESQLGTPATVEPIGAGKRRVLYRAEMTKQPNNLRALIRVSPGDPQCSARVARCRRACRP